MKHILVILISLITFSQGFSINSVVIRLKTVSDSVQAHDDFLESKRHSTLTNVLKFKNASDSIYVSLKVTCYMDCPYMDCKLKCNATYNFVDSIPDGIYKIEIDNEPIEKVSFINGERHGYACTYAKRPYMQPYLNTSTDNRSYYLQTYVDNDITEYYSLDEKGNIIEYSPVVQDSIHSLSDLPYLTYSFDKKGRLRSIHYFKGKSTHYYSDYFSKRKTYLKTEARYKAENDTNWISKSTKLNGVREIKIQNIHYILNFANGSLLNWKITTDNSTTTLWFNKSSDTICMKKTDIMNFIEQ